MKMFNTKMLPFKKLTSLIVVFVMLTQICLLSFAVGGFFVSDVRPEITGVKNGEIYDGPVEIKIKDAFKASLNEQEIDRTGIIVKEDGEYEVKAVHIDGGRTVVSFTLSSVKPPEIDYKALAVEMEKIDESISKAIESIENPIPGLSIEPVVTIDLTEKDDKNLQVALPAEKISEMNDKSLGLSLDTKDVKIKIDSEVLKENIEKEDPKEIIVSKASVDEEDAKIMKSKITKENPEGEQISEVRDFNLQIKDKDENVRKIREFSKRVEVEIKLSDEEKAKIKDPKKAAVYNLLPNGTYEYVGGNYNPETGNMEFETNHFSFYVVMENNKTFNDISSSFAMKDIEILASRNIIKGTDSANTKYDPKGTITRGQFAIMISKVLGLRPERYSAVFRDVGDKSYYTGYVLSAYKYNLIRGDGVAFRPDDVITREQIATIMISAMKNVNAGLVKENGGTDLAFVDKSNISTYALGSISEAKRLGIMRGFPDNSFMPKKPLTREEAASAIVSLMNAAKMI